MKKHSLSIVVLFISCALTLAQETEKAESYRKWEIGFTGTVARCVVGVVKT